MAGVLLYTILIILFCYYMSIAYSIHTFLQLLVTMSGLSFSQCVLQSVHCIMMCTSTICLCVLHIIPLMILGLVQPAGMH